jgi:hypothetical protein
MSYSNAWLLRRASIARTMLVDSIAFYILVMMASMLVGAVLYFEQPTQVGLAEALGLSLIVMSVGVLAVLHYWTKNDAVEDDTLAVRDESTDEQELQRSIVISRAYVVYFLVMMASMTAVGIVYIFDTTTVGLNVGLVLGNAIMIPGIVMILLYASRHPGHTEEPSQVYTSKRFGRWTLVFLVLLNEFVMGWAFALASGNLATANGSLLGVVSTLNYVTGSDWFLFSLSFEILFSIYMLRRYFSRDFIRIVGLQSLTLILVPTAIDGYLWSTSCIIAGVLIFASFSIVSFRPLRDGQVGSRNIRKYLKTMLVLDALIVIGLMLWTLSRIDLMLFACLVGEAVLYFNSILERVSMEKGARISVTERSDADVLHQN